jgi:hypothetical protein
MLTQFYKDLLAWVDAGCPPHKAFQKRTGLCGNLIWWCKDSACDKTHPIYEMQNQFREAGKNLYFPFNYGHDEHYAIEYALNTLFHNKQRLDWIKRHANPVL